MARVTSAMISWADMDDMVTYEGYRYLLDAPALPANMNKCANYVEIPTYIYCNISGTWANNQLVAWNYISRKISTDPEALYWTATGSGKSLTIYTPNAWTASESVSWLSLSATSGSGNTTITVTAQTNVTTSQRTANITVTDTTTSDTFIVAVTQEAGTGVAVSPINITIQESSAANACANYPDFTEILYIPTAETWATATKIYSDSNGVTVFNGSGWCSNGVVARNWTGTVFTGSNVNC